MFCLCFGEKVNKRAHQNEAGEFLRKIECAGILWLRCWCACMLRWLEGESWEDDGGVVGGLRGG